jgi:Zn-dependent M28 family amino/carboxypeptidase
MTILASALIFSTIPFEAGARADVLRVSGIINRVSGGRIMQTIEDLQDFGSRAFYLNTSQDAASYILEQFEELNVSVAYQEFIVSTHSVRNVVATMPGTSESSPQFLFGAHYDSENRDARNLSDGQRLAAPGADDDASGVASVLELARILSGCRLKNTVKFVAFGAEEYGYDFSGGLEGSLAFVQSEKAAGAAYAGCWILDMIGYEGGYGNHTVVVVNGNSAVLGTRVRESVQTYDIQLAVDVVIDPSITYSDHSRFWADGYPAALVIESSPSDNLYQFNPYYHSSNDTLDKLSEGQIVSVTKGLAATLLEMSSPVRGNETVIVLAGMAIAVTVATTMYICIVRRRGRQT